MSRFFMRAILPAMLFGLILVSSANAQCVYEDFEGYAVGAAVTTGLEGVTISVVGQSCSGSPFLYARCSSTFYGDSFSSKALLIDTGCPDFSDDYIRMIFNDKQGEIRFSVGPWATTYYVRAYATVSGGSPVQSKTVNVPGSGFVGVHYPVEVSRAQRDIRRIEIEAKSSGHEAIDNLSFGFDSTPPEVSIDEPAPLDCISGEFTVTGRTCDEDGAYDRDRLEYMRAWPGSQTDWTLVREFVGSPVCDPFSLYSWDTTEPGVTDGLYVLRATSINKCGMTATDEVLVHVDNAFDTLELRRPQHGDIVGGAICFDGTAWDRSCFDHYVVQFRPAGGGAWLPVDAAFSKYTQTVSNDPLAYWTEAQGLPDGDYTVALAGYSETGASTSRQILLTLDNTKPISEIQSPESCESLSGNVLIKGTAFDANIDEWALHYYDPFAQSWKYISDDSDNVVNDTLGTWDTSGLIPCFYVLRLRVKDAAVVNGCTDPDPHVTDHYLPVAVGIGGLTDLDFDGDTDLDDFGIFQDAFTGLLP